MEAVVHKAGALGEGHEFGLEPDQRLRGDDVFEADAAVLAYHHVLELRAARAQAVHDGALEFGRAVQHEQFDGLYGNAVLFVGDDDHLGDAELEALAAHGLDKDGEVQLAAARDLEAGLANDVLHFQPDIDLLLLVEPVAELGGGHEFSFAAGQRAVVGIEFHGEGGLLDLQAGEHSRVLHVGDGVSYFYAFQAGHGDDIAGMGFLDDHALEVLVAHELHDLADPGLGDGAGYGDLLGGGDPAGHDAAHADAAGVGAVVEHGHQQAERLVVQVEGAGDMLDDGLEKVGEVGGFVIEVLGSPAVAADGVDYGEVKLGVGSAELHEQGEHFVERGVGVAVEAVDLVYDHDGAQAEGEGFLEDEAGLRHGAVEGVDQEQDAVDHPEDAFDFAAEVGVAGGVDYMDGGVFIADGGVLGEDGDAPLFFEVVGVHDADGFFAAFVMVGAGLLEHGVHEGGFAVVDVGDDGDVAKVLAALGCVLLHVCMVLLGKLLCHDVL